MGKKVDVNKGKVLHRQQNLTKRNVQGGLMRVQGTLGHNE